MERPRVTTLSRIILVVGLGLWAGGTSFFSFVAAPRIFAHLRDELPNESLPGVDGLDAEIGRRLAGDTVGAIFPSYFAAQIVAGTIAALAGCVLAWRGARIDMLQNGVVIAALALVTLHALTVYPRSVRILDTHHAAQAAGDMSQAATLRETFGMWHGISQLLNLVTIVLVLCALGMAGITPRDRA